MKKEENSVKGGDVCGEKRVICEERRVISVKSVKRVECEEGGV